MNANSDSSSRGLIVAALFHDPAGGEQALADLKATGFNRSEISEVGGRSATAEARSDSSAAEAPSGSSFFSEHDSSASSFADELVALGFSNHDAHDLVDALVAGSALVTVDARKDAARATAILTQYGGDVRRAGATTTAPAPRSDDREAERRLELRAERLQLNKERVQHGEARIRKEVVTEVKSIDVPVTREELVIEERPVSASTSASAEPIGSEQAIRIPLTEEKINVSKETVVREEVTIGKRVVEDVEHVNETVRHEELRIDDPTHSDARSTRGSSDR